MSECVSNLSASAAPCFSEKGAIKSGVTVAGFAGARRPHPGRHTTTPADFRHALAVTLRTPAACSMRRNGHPSLPSAMTCCFFFAQDIAHAEGAYKGSSRNQCLGPYYGRFSADPTWPDLGDP
jgi:hypothetical protein